MDIIDKKQFDRIFKLMPFNNAVNYCIRASLDDTMRQVEGKIRFHKFMDDIKYNGFISYSSSDDYNNDIQDLLRDRVRIKKYLEYKDSL